jgi:hypothetical protein
MDPLSDFDRALRDAMQVEPGGDFAARVRARVATAPRESPSLIPRFAIAAMTCVLLAVVAAGVWRETAPFVADSVLPHRDLTVLSEPPRVLSSPPQLTPPGSRVTFNAANVVVSRSEMLALQRLFSGLTVAPRPLDAPPDELSVPEELLIPKIVIEPLVPVVSGPEGERQ